MSKKFEDELEEELEADAAEEYEEYEDDDEYEEEYDEYEEDEYDDEEEYFEEEEEPSFLSRFATFAVVVVAISGFVWLAWYAYSIGTNPKSPADVPLITADASPLTKKPDDPGGMRVPYRDKEIYESLAGEPRDLPKVERIMAAPEEPVDLRETESAAVDEEGEGSALEPKIVFMTGDVKGLEEDLASGIEAEAEQLGKLEPAAQSPVSESQPEMAEEPEATSFIDPDPNKSVVSPLSEFSEPEASSAEPAPEQTAQPEPEPVKEPVKQAETRPAPKPAPAAKPEPKEMEVASVPKKMPKPDQLSSVRRDSISGMRLQLGSFRSVNGADDAWKRISQKHGGTLKGLDYTIERADLGSKGVFYRLQAGPIPSRQKADNLCGKLKAGNQGCFVVK